MQKLSLTWTSTEWLADFKEPQGRLHCARNQAWPVHAQNAAAKLSWAEFKKAQGRLIYATSQARAEMFTTVQISISGRLETNQASALQMLFKCRKAHEDDSVSFSFGWNKIKVWIYHIVTFSCPVLKFDWLGTIYQAVLMVFPNIPRTSYFGCWSVEHDHTGRSVSFTPLLRWVIWLIE